MAHPNAKLWRNIELDGSVCVLPGNLPDAIATHAEAIGMRLVAEPTKKWQQAVRGPDSQANTEGRWVPIDAPEPAAVNVPRVKSMTALERQKLIADLVAEGDLPEGGV